MKLCALCTKFLLDDEIDNCRDDLCFDCCEESFHIDGTTCDQHECPYTNCISRNMDTKQDDITDIFK